MPANEPDPPRRWVLLGLAASLAPAPAPAQVAPPRKPVMKGAVGEAQAIDGIAYLRAVTPPRIVQLSWRARQATSDTEAVMEQAQAAPVREFRDYLDNKVARADKLRQLAMVNVYVNDRVKQVADDKVYVSTDLWAAPLNTLLIGGDCEDLVLLKRWGLARLGFDRKDMYLVGGVSRAGVSPTFHAVLLVILRPGSKGVLLDNLSHQVHLTKEGARFEPTYAINEYGFWRVENPNPADRKYWDGITNAINRR